MLSLSILSSKLSSYLCFHRLLFFIQITAMIHSLPLGKDCETSTSSQLSPCPRVSNGDDQEPAQVVIAQDDEEEELDKMNHDQLRSGGAIELDYCSGKANHGTEAAGINWTSSDHMIPLIPIKPTHYDSSCRNPARVCVDCNTTNTPLWRSGPQGPKSLCNACGIRYRKARRALSAIVASDDQSKFQSLNRPTLKRAKLQEHIDPSLSSRKRTKLAISGYSHCSSEKELNQNGSHQLCFKMQNLHLGSDDHHSEELYYAPNTFSLGKRPAFRRVFPKDEVEAAVMLMALSCGLING